MLFELQMALIAAFIPFVHIVAQGPLTIWEAGGGWAAGPRDKPVERSVLAGRCERAFRNYTETAPAFCLAVILVVATERTNTLTQLGTAAYAFGRIAYIPAYIAGVPWLRPLVWVVATGGIVMTLLGVSGLF